MKPASWSASLSRVELGGVARFAFDVDRRILGGQIGEDALVIDLDDVHLCARRTA